MKITALKIRIATAAASVVGVTLLGASLLHAQALTRPKSVPISAHIVVTEPLPMTDARLAKLKLPAGFQIARWADGLDTPRVISAAPNGDVYVSSREGGTISLLRGTDHASAPQVVAHKKNVHGLALLGANLYYAAATETFVAPIRADGSLGPEKQIAAGLPDVGQHNDRSLAFGPDGWLYESVGSNCNECEEQNPESATIVRMRPDGSGRAVFASGLRNTIGFAFRPGTSELWGWDDGVDWLGDDAQREELNLIAHGHKYGWPYVFGDGQLNFYRDPPKGQGTVEQWDKDSTRPALTWTAHSSGMQLLFYTGTMFPAAYRGDAFVTLHGSWNRSPPSGYEMVRVHFEGERALRIEPFLTGFLAQTGAASWSRFARPMGLTQLKDGSLLLGDDQNGVIYRITYRQ